MTVDKLLDQIERRADSMLTGKAPVNRLELLSLLEDELEELLSMDQFSWAQKILDPMIQTEPGVRDYLLPNDFPDNFMRTGDSMTGEPKHSVMLDDGSSNSYLTYESPQQFAMRDLSAETSARPEVYTIKTTTSGKFISLAPPPNTTDYTISGSYIPSHIRLEPSTDVAPVSEVLRYGVLRRLDPNQFGGDYVLALRKLFYKDALNNPAAFSMDRRMTRNLINSGV